MHLDFLDQLALKEADSSWFPGFDSELLELARASRRGERWLFAYLAVRFELFGRPLLKDDNRKIQRALPWLFLPAVQWGPVMLHIGALACSAHLRSVVSRDRVLQLQRVLGLEVYGSVMSFRVAASGTEGLGPLDQEHQLALEDLSDRQLTDLLRAEGLRELVWFARQHDVLAGERVSLAHPCDQGQPLIRSRVGADLISDCLKSIVTP